ncbi:MAG: hypothetical protein JKY95_16435 [Planctomycetaceae bacterium]|nr:hypothetical protein [Planctomycetaceae bacterium]
MSDLDNLSVAEIQQMLKKQQGRVQQLQKKRAKLAEDITNIDAEIAELTGQGTGVRFKNKYSNEDAICNVLSKYKKGLPLAELADAVLKSGHQTTSNNFKNIVYQCIHKSPRVTRDVKTKRYQLQK